MKLKILGLLAIVLVMVGCMETAEKDMKEKDNAVIEKDEREENKMELEYRIEELGEFTVAGLKISTTNENNQGYIDAPAFWGEVIKESKQMEMLPLMNQAPFGIIGMNIYNTDTEDARKFDYYIGCSTDMEIPENMVSYTVKPYTWAVFPCKMEEINEVMSAIVIQWLPESGYELVNSGYETGFMEGGAPDMEVYGEGDDVEIWVAVKK